MVKRGAAVPECVDGRQSVILQRVSKMCSIVILTFRVLTSNVLIKKQAIAVKVGMHTSHFSVGIEQQDGPAPLRKCVENACDLRPELENLLPPFFRLLSVRSGWFAWCVADENEDIVTTAVDAQATKASLKLSCWRVYLSDIPLVEPLLL